MLTNSGKNFCFKGMYEDDVKYFIRKQRKWMVKKITKFIDFMDTVRKFGHGFITKKKNSIIFGFE